MNTTTFQLPVDEGARFIIAPFEHRGAHFEARPQLAVRFPLYEATFELKACREWLFFCDKERPDAVFAIPSAPLGLDSPQDAAQWLELALEGGQFHRYLALENVHPRLEGTFLFFFGADGRGFVREPWDESGPQFEWNGGPISTPAFLIWSRELFLEAAAELMDAQNSQEIMYDLVGRDIEDEQRGETPLEWMCGSREELETLTRALLHTQPDWNGAARMTARFSSESEYGRAALNWVRRDDLYKPEPPSPRLQTLSDLFLDFNTPVGHRWEFQDAMGGRASWEPEGHGITIEVSAPTSHERLEAHLLLRDWLSGKVAPDEIESLVGS